ncbi:hypothetical protein FQA39_LY10467 [Lamprigera yunnana]|nr:hypothetical protein FQA39_LY10467 [Lamprigera yunnana]
MSIDDIEQKIAHDIKTVTKQIYATTKPTRSKIKQDTRELMDEKRNMTIEDLQYSVDIADNLATDISDAEIVSQIIGRQTVMNENVDNSDEDDENFTVPTLT